MNPNPNINYKFDSTPNLLGIRVARVFPVGRTYYYFEKRQTSKNTLQKNIDIYEKNNALYKKLKSMIV